MKQIVFSANRLLSPAGSPILMAELLLLLAVKDGEERILFEKRGRQTYPIGFSKKDRFEYVPFEAFLGGRILNHYRDLCEIRYPVQQGCFVGCLAANTVDVRFEIMSPGQSSFAELTISNNFVDPEQCRQLLQVFFAKKQSQKTYLQRLRDRFSDWLDAE